MRACFVYEKFTEDSDPIKDMDIGLASFEDRIYNIKLSWDKKRIRNKKILELIKKYDIHYEVIKYIPATNFLNRSVYIRFMGERENLIDFIMVLRSVNIVLAGDYWGINREEAIEYLKKHKSKINIYEEFNT